jgi:hypothetical protein
MTRRDLQPGTVVPSPTALPATLWTVTSDAATPHPRGEAQVTHAAAADSVEPALLGQVIHDLRPRRVREGPETAGVRLGGHPVERRGREPTGRQDEAVSRGITQPDTVRSHFVGSALVRNNALRFGLADFWGLP